MPSEQTASPTINDRIQEVQGIFPSDAALQDAIGRLTRAGFDRAAISLPAANPAAAEATPAAGAENPNTEDDVRQSRTLHSSMAASVGAMAGAGVVVATGGAALLAGAAALGLGAAAGGAMEAIHGTADRLQSEGREQAAAAGELVLAAAAHDPDAVLKATDAMQQAGATRIETVTREGGAIV
jgi:hypothetical protein